MLYNIGSHCLNEPRESPEYIRIVALVIIIQLKLKCPRSYNSRNARIIVPSHDNSHVYIYETPFIATTLGTPERARLFEVMMPLYS
jgi:hypothetical protein